MKKVLVETIEGYTVEGYTQIYVDLGIFIVDANSFDAQTLHLIK